MQNTIITINIGKSDKLPIIEYKKIVKSNNKNKVVTSNDNNKLELWMD